MNGAGRVLIVEDDLDARWLLAKGCLTANYAVSEAASGTEALNKLAAEPFDVMLLDLGLPDIDGIEILRQSESKVSDLITIILTANPTQESAITAIRSGVVADYLKKPVTIKKVLDVIAAKLEQRALQQRRLIKLGIVGNHVIGAEREPWSHDQVTEDDGRVIRQPGVELDPTAHVVTVLGRDVPEIILTEGETALLAAMLRKPGRALTYQDLAYEAWGDRIDRQHASSIIRPIIFRLRQKLERDPSVPRIIRTVRGVGYMFHPALS